MPSLELSENEKRSLALCFGGIESMLFMASNFGAMLEKLSQLPPRERMERITGTVAMGVEPPVMAVKTTHTVRISDEPWKLEAWCCPSNQGVDSEAGSARAARSALVSLVERGDSWAVTVLYKLYGGVVPALESSDLSFLGEYAGLVLDTPTVQKWAERCTVKGRRKVKDEDWFVEQRLNDQRGRVTERAALNDLLSSERRKEYEDAIRLEAHQLAIRAISAYKRAL